MVTIVPQFDDQVRAVSEEKLSREAFFRGLFERFVLVPVKTVEANGDAEIVLLAGAGDAGMFLPIFTSAEHFAKTALARENRLAQFPFDTLMRQVRPDTGIVINPGADPTYEVRWFVAQEYVADIGAEVIKQEVTPEWLDLVNADFAKAEMPPEQRPWEAIPLWSTTNSAPLSTSSARARLIFDWFRANTKPGAGTVGSIGTTAFFYDAAFWEVEIPFAYGAPPIAPFDLLHMPASVKSRFLRERNEVYVYLKFFADTFDYFYTVDDLRGGIPGNPFLEGLIAAGREHILQAASLLLATRPNAKAAEASRFALEIFLKILLVSKGGLTERDVRDLSHNLKKLLDRCLSLDPSSPLKRLQGKLDIYPDVGARYRADELPRRDLWIAYSLALEAGTIVMKPMSDRDTAATISVQWPESHV